MTLKNKIKQFRYSPNRAYTITFRILKPVWKVIRLVREPRKRAELLSPLLSGKQQFQDLTFTRPYRYPRLFEQYRLFFQNHTELSILSFGCSTGEEVFTLLDCTPQAKITGIDINPWCIRECNRKNQNDCISFGLRNSELFDSLANLNAIFCMAVFQNMENRKKKTLRTTKITFERFEKELALLDQKLRVGGLFFIDQCDFDLTDTILYSHYTPLVFEANRVERALPVFNRKNDRIADTRNFYRVFVKQVA